jgi:predicted CXXCH cytochrome family protein
VPSVDEGQLKRLAGKAKMALQKKQSLLTSLVWAAFAVLAFQAYALDPPHDSTKSVQCTGCHTPHNATAGALTTSPGNSNSCLTCHVVGGTGAAKPFADTDQAYPRVGSVGLTPQGSSHRWDSGPGGHVEPFGSITSTGTVQSGGAFTGRYPKRYTIAISTAGAVGTARFNWSVTMANGAAGTGSGTGVLTGTNVALDEGVTVTFTNGATPTSFVLGNTWYIYVQTDLTLPTNAGMVARIDSGKVLCSTCHDQHSQAKEPYDSAAPAYAGAGTGAGRHFQRVDNNTGQMCNECHGARNVTSATSGSHPVNITPLVVAGSYKAPSATLPLDKTTAKIQCLTCHDTHYTPSTDGSLSRVANFNTLCTDCHLNSDTAAGAHFNATTGALWPGGQYGSTYPAIDSTKRGMCINCHDPHGWPDDATPANDFPHLTVERSDQLDTRADPADAEDMCYTCHDGSPLTNSNIQADFAKTIHHPVKDTEQTTGRSVECRDCHSIHKARAGAHNYAATATSTRNQTSNPLKSVSGVSVSYTGLANFVAPPSANYTAINAATGAALEYQICFKCHTNYGYAATTAGTATFTAASGTVAGSGTAWNAGLVGATIQRTGDTTTYTVTAVASATSLTITPVYAGTTGSGAAYTIWNPSPGVTPIYNTGTAALPANSATVTGTGTSWSAGMVGQHIRWGTSTTNREITAVASATSMTVTPQNGATAIAASAYTISGETNLAQEFSPNNKSGHPVVTGLDNYPNSTAVGSPAKRGLQTADLAAPWNTNIGTQTMMCSDCHNTDAATPAAQGPHGSAAQFMLRSWGNGEANGVGTAVFTNGSATVTGSGTNWLANMVGGKIAPAGTATPYTITARASATSITISPAYAGATTASVTFSIWNPPANWPNVTNTNWAGSWCANCHRKGSNAGHTKGDHSSSACYRCHIVIPHGGKISRLIADADGTMPARYAYQNLVSNVYFTNFIKAAAGSYTENSSCRTTSSCDHHTGGPTTGENW